MEHALRKHCTVHHDEDPAFYQSPSEKVENLINQYKGQWEKLVEGKSCVPLPLQGVSKAQTA